MNKYTSGKIYQIVAPDGSKYIGSTISTLTCRFGNHKRLYKAWKVGKQRNTSVFALFDVYGVEKCKIELIENYSCDSKKELEKREGYIIKTTDCINKVIAGRTSEEYRVDNMEILREKFKDFYNKNREAQVNRVSQYYIENKDKVTKRMKIYSHENLDKIRERKRKYRHDNAEKIKEQKRAWRERNRDRVNARKRELRRLSSVDTHST